MKTRLATLLSAWMMAVLLSFQAQAYDVSPVMPGDATCDRVIDIDDVNAVINHMVRKAMLEGKALQNADMMRDGVIDIDDLNALVNHMIHKGYAHSEPMSLVVELRDGSRSVFPLSDDPQLTIEGDELKVASHFETTFFARSQLSQLYYVTATQAQNLRSPQRASVGENHNQFAIYIYRNDNDFNAHLNIDIESIRFSAVGTDSLWYDNALVQEVWTPDSVYRTPLAAVDSLTFQAPRPVLKEGLYVVNENNLGYVTYTDDNTIRFSPSTPASVLPSVGQVIVSELYEEPVADGFAGRATSATTLPGGEIEYVCEDVTFEDIFDQFVLVAKATNNSQVHGNRVRPRRLFGLDNPDGAIITLDDLIPEVTLGYGDFPLSLKYHPVITVDYVLYVQRHEPTHIRLVISGDHTFTPQLELENESAEIKKTAWLFHESGDWTKSKPKEIPIGHGFKLTWNVGAFFKLAAKVGLQGSIPITVHHALGFDYHGRGLDVTNGNVIHDFDIDVGQPELSVNLKGSAAFGLAAEIGCNFIHRKLAGISGTLNVGPKLSASLDLSSQGLMDGTYYSLLKDSKIKCGIDIGLDVDYTLVNKKFKMTPGQGWPGVKRGDPVDGKWDLAFEWEIPWKEWKLLPSFTTPVIKHYENGNVTISTTPGDNLFLPAYVGMALYNSQNEMVAQRTGKTDDYWYWGKSQSTPRQFTISGLNAMEQYTCRPMVTLFGDYLVAAPPKTFKATTLTAPDQVMVPLNGETRVSFDGCSGMYTLVNRNHLEDKIRCSIEGDKLKFTGLKKGETSVLLSDKETGEQKVINVTVGDAVSNLTLSTDAVQVGVNETQAVTITGGSGNYEAVSDHPQTATAYVHKTNGPSGGNDGLDAPRRTPVEDGYYEVVITGKNAGTAVVTVTDTQTGQTAAINVTITGSSNPQMRTYTVNGVSFKMIAVEGGTFTMGATAEQDSDAYFSEYPAHQVTLSSYAIGETEVTQALWVAVMGSNPSSFTGNLQRPVEQVSWDDCQAFITKLNELTGAAFRLPTEAEWEYAARGGNKSKGYKYAGSNTVGDVAWYESNSGSTTHPVATKAANELGLHDMSGNVAEWCQDWYDYYSSSPTTNPTGPASGSYRVHRGGSWFVNARPCRVSSRYSDTPSFTRYLLGFRLAL